MDNELLMDDVSDLVVLANKLDEVEEQLKAYRELQNSYDNFKSELLEGMKQHGIKKFTSVNGTQFTVVSDSPEKTEIILAFNEDRFKEDHLDLYRDYLEKKEKITKARAGYLRITLPKNEEENNELITRE